MMANWKTTAAGVAAIATALGDIANQFATHGWDANHLGLDMMGIANGIGLLFAKDMNVTGGTVKQ